MNVWLANQILGLWLLGASRCPACTRRVTKSLHLAGLHTIVEDLGVTVVGVGFSHPACGHCERASAGCPVLGCSSMSLVYAITLPARQHSICCWPGSTCQCILISQLRQFFLCCLKSRPHVDFFNKQLFPFDILLTWAAILVEPEWFPMKFATFGVIFSDLNNLAHQRMCLTASLFMTRWIILEHKYYISNTFSQNSSITKGIMRV